MELRKDKIEKIFYLLFVLSLIFDNVNGVLLQNNIIFPISVGQLYRIFSILIMFTTIFMMYKNKIKNYPKILCLFLILVILTFIYFFQHKSISGWSQDFLYATKLFFPVLIIICLHELYKKNLISIHVIEKIMKTYSILAPLSLIIPSIFGVDFGSYNLGGTKGFYVSNNEINIVLICTFIFSIHTFFNKKNIKNFIIFILNTIGLFIITSKTSLAILAFVTLYYILKNINSRKDIFIYLVGIISVILIFSVVFQDMIFETIARLKYFYNDLTLEGTIIDFIMSTRNRRVIPALNEVIFNGTVVGIINGIIGIGRYQQVIPNKLSTLMELDFFDTWLWFGLIVAIIILIYYISILWKTRKLKDVVPYRMMYFLILLFSLTAGHVWYSPLAGTMLGLSGCYLLFKKDKRETEEPLISVVMPAYNVECYIEKCVMSVLGQSYKNLQIILVEDGAKDNTGNICDKLAKIDRRIQVIHKENGGLSDARNAGIDIAKGKYILFIDSDDFIHSDMILNLYENLIEYNADISVCSYQRLKENEKVENLDYDYSIECLTNNIFECMYNQFGNDTIVAWNKLYKIELFDKVRYPYGKIHEDEFVIHKLLAKCNCIVYDSRKMYYYIQHGNTITSSFNLKRLYVVEALQERLKFFKESNSHKLYDMTLKTYCLTLMYWWQVLVDYPEYVEARDNLLKKFNNNYKNVLNSKHISFINKLKIAIAAKNPNLLLKLMNLKRKIRRG